MGNAGSSLTKTLRLGLGLVSVCTYEIELNPAVTLGAHSSHPVLDVSFPGNAKCTSFLDVKMAVEELRKDSWSDDIFDAHHFAPVHNERIILFS